VACIFLESTLDEQREVKEKETEPQITAKNADF
jgi:hypothetical protein